MELDGTGTIMLKQYPMPAIETVGNPGQLSIRNFVILGHKTKEGAVKILMEHMQFPMWRQKLIRFILWRT